MPPARTMACLAAHPQLTRLQRRRGLRDSPGGVAFEAAENSDLRVGNWTGLSHRELQRCRRRGRLAGRRTHRAQARIVAEGMLQIPIRIDSRDERDGLRAGSERPLDWDIDHVASICRFDAQIILVPSKLESIGSDSLVSRRKRIRQRVLRSGA